MPGSFRGARHSLFKESNVAWKQLKPFRGAFDWRNFFQNDVANNANRAEFAKQWGLNKTENGRTVKGPRQWGWDYFHGNWGKMLNDQNPWQDKFDRQRRFYKAAWDMWDDPEFSEIRKEFGNWGDEQQDTFEGGAEDTFNQDSGTTINYNAGTGSNVNYGSGALGGGQDEPYFGENIEGGNTGLSSSGSNTGNTQMPDFWR